MRTPETDILTTKVVKNLIISLIISFIGVIIGKLFIPPALAAFCSILVIFILIATCILKAISQKRKNKPMKFSMNFVYLITFLFGISTYPSIAYYVSALGAKLVFISFLITIITFSALFAYSYFSNKDFSFLGSFLFFSLICIIFLSIANIFLHIGTLNLIICFFGILIFSGYILYDVSIIKNQYFTEDDIPMIVLNLYFDFLNLFLYILDFLSIISDFVD